MKIATYNVRNLYDPGTMIDDRATEGVQEGFFNKRIAYFTERLRSLDLDIICLQEVGGEMGVQLLGEALSYGYFFARPNKRGIRMAVLYKKSLAMHITCESVHFGELHIPSIQVAGDTESLQPIKQSRDILEITVKTDTKTLSINTFHLKSNLPQYLDSDDAEHNNNEYIDAKFRCVFYKTMEMCALRRHVTARLAEGKEVMLLGDYNENNTASIMDILKAAQVDELRLDDVLADYVGDATTHIHRGGKLVFDTILISQGLKDKVVEVKVENADLEDCSMLPPDTEVVGSDHALVWVDVRL